MLETSAVFQENSLGGIPVDEPFPIGFEVFKIHELLVGRAGDSFPVFPGQCLEIFVDHDALVGGFLLSETQGMRSP